MSESLRDQLAEAYDKHETPAEPAVETVVETVEQAATAEKSARTLAAEKRSREEGKFAKEPKEKPEPDPVVLKPRPSSWKKDFDPHWGKLDPTLQDYLHQRESEYAKGVSTYKAEAERAKAIFDALAPHQALMQQNNVRPEQLVQNMMMRHQALTDPQQKMRAWLQLANDYGVPVQQWLAHMQRPQVGAEGQPVPQPQADPRYNALAQQMSAINNQLNTWRTEQARSQQEGIGREIEGFAKDGKHPHFETMRGTMADLLEKGVAATLEDAYSIALRMPQHDDIRTAMEDEARRAAQAAAAREASERAAAARRRNVIPRSASPGNAVDEPDRKGLRDTIASAMESHAGRV